MPDETLIASVTPEFDPAAALGDDAKRASIRRVVSRSMEGGSG